MDYFLSLTDRHFNDIEIAWESRKYDNQDMLMTIQYIGSRLVMAEKPPKLEKLLINKPKEEILDLDDDEIADAFFGEQD